jgi:hypothetical protein
MQAGDEVGRLKQLLCPVAQKHRVIDVRDFLRLQVEHKNGVWKECGDGLPHKVYSIQIYLSTERTYFQYTMMARNQPYTNEHQMNLLATDSL